MDISIRQTVKVLILSLLGIFTSILLKVAVLLPFIFKPRECNAFRKMHSTLSIAYHRLNCHHFIVDYHKTAVGG